MPKNEFVCDCPVCNKKVVELVFAKIQDDQTLSSIANFYQVLSDPTRCKILAALKIHELCVCDLANVLSMTKSSVSHQLAKMKQLGVVKFRREGRKVIYSPNDNHVISIFETTLNHVNHLNKEH